MKNLIAVVLLLGCGVVQAAAVIIDFEEYDGVCDASPFSTCDADNPLVTDQGFLFSPLDSKPIELSHPADETGGFGTTSIFLSRDDYGSDVIEISEASSSNFNFYGFATIHLFNSTGLIDSIIGYKENGTQVTANNIEINGSYINLINYGDFSNLVRVEIFSNEANNVLVLDNFMVQTVPIPAAVWLFGSALGGLGWMRRKKS
jgi:hypothetical protein